MSSKSCESCAWWDEMIAKAEKRVHDALDRWERARLNAELANYRDSREDHLRMPHGRYSR
ncbi:MULTISPECIES: hypothetical protein [Streptomyces]|uniref:hypothetical protein n=1 Tax=Streptomyces TaxID=1883 RepID=UPI00163D35F3|nr:MULTISPECIES: hypothetical protein [Streptomyces]MBC2877629.1 hypothetical protein [Streptomyces sp. TYQ1024]UBI36140.1 hypothetical protein K7I03_06475 [Streptomyces mobaraensis]UKW28735.1 hypothetical protein MCU78_06460 [Streptomyces sp. TYQ1024]